eukprot:SRR837773.11002.p1 GENE.SRR837773.11002~~SRR837773.11002.p1  ORF type:complete len:374 (-),score=107.90 SRR837773.11002:56-1087(-)
MACSFAQSHPEAKVLCMDMSEEGDLTKRLMGGVDAARQKVSELFGTLFKLVDDAKKEAPQTVATRLKSLFLGKRDADLDVVPHCIRLADHNANVPGNVYLVSSGAYATEEEPMTPEELRSTAGRILGALERSPDSWQLFCDTDGDRRPSTFTKLAYNLCDLAIVPLQCSKSDMDRTETMFGMMNDLRQRGEINTQILMVVWNMVKAQRNEPCEVSGLTLPFTPAKINAEIMSACNERLCACAWDPAMSGLFLGAGPDTTEADFLSSSVTAVRQFADNAQRPAEELGMPFARMLDLLRESGKTKLTFDSTGVKYQVDAEVLGAADRALSVLTAKFEAMSLAADR